MQNSYWIDSAKLPTFPALGKDVEVDVIVIGGGIMGITTAYLAKQAGKRVALIDRARCASVDTGHTTAHLTAVTDLRLQEIAKTFGKDAARATWDAGIAAIDQIVTLIRREAIACDFRWVPGYLHLPIGESDPKRLDELKEELEEEAKTAGDFGISSEMMSSVPFFNVPGVRFDHQALFHPRKYLKALLEKIPGAGSYVFEETNAEEISDEPLTVKSGNHTIRGSYLVLATHNPIMGNTGMLSATLFQTKLALYTSYVVSGRIPPGSLPEASFWDNGESYDYLRVEQRGDDAYVVFGGEDHKTGQQSDTDEPFRRLEERLRGYLPQIEIDHRWSGQVIETNDGLPLIGETAKNQFAATGFSGNGMTFGTLGAMMAVDALLGRENAWQDLFDIHRKKILGGAWTYLVENKDFPFHLVRDWLASGESESLSQLRAGEGKILKLDGKKVAAHRDEQGNVTLCSPICTHLKCIVDWNNAESTWDCPCHGSRFKPTGEVISGPAEKPLERLPVPSEK